MATEDEELAGLVGTLEAGAIPVDHVCAELGPGCLEIATAPELAVRSADSAALAKLYTKAYFARAGRQRHLHGSAGIGVPRSRRAPQPVAPRLDRSTCRCLCDEPGCPLQDRRRRRRRRRHPAARAPRHGRPLPELIPALRARQLGPVHRDVGFGQLQLRAAGRARRAATARLELRIPGADTSPHHCLAMFLGAALWGIEERLDPPPPVIAPADGRVAPGTAALPRDLVEAAERFAASAAARDLFGPAFVEHYAAVPSGRGRGLPSLRLRRGAGPLPRPGLTGRHRTEALGPGDPVSSEFELSARSVETFDRDGFVIVEDLIDPALARRALDRYEDLFAGHFETGLYPDEWNWRPGVNAPDLTRQICNAWKSDRDIARRRAPTRHRAGLRPAGRVARSPTEPGQRPVEAARVASRSDFTRTPATSSGPCPSDWVSCWIALEDTTAAQGTVEYVRGSHRWSRRWGMIDQFHGPADPHADLRQAAAANGGEPELVPVEVPAGGGAFHDGWTWHGSDVNRSRRPAALAGGPLHVLRGPLPSRHDRLPLQPLQAVRRRRDGRVVLPDHLARGRLPLALPRSLPAPPGRLGGCAAGGLQR